MTDLLEATAALVDIPSLSHQETALADLVEGVLRGCSWLQVERIGDNVIGRTLLGRSQRLMLAGHLDTVPANDNARARIDGDVLWGLGASDMKGGLAVMLDLARTVPEPSIDVTWCFYATEEVGRDQSGLLQLWNERPELLKADAAILGEPTDALVEAGCQGTMSVLMTLGGVRAHSARPFAGRNAIHRLAPILSAAAAYQSRKVELDGCVYAEQVQAVLVDGGVARNVVPDQVHLTVNHRFAPDRTAEEAESFLRELLGAELDESAGDRWELLDAAAGAPPSLTQPLLAELVAKTGTAPTAKVGWTDVASFWEHGIPAANFGPGDPLLAHHPDERVTREQLTRARAILGALIG
ncbi:MAG TPA: succinyl-diaminopimelate desuccinylase [Acidimicrobiales bacterium]